MTILGISQGTKLGTYALYVSLSRHTHSTPWYRCGRININQPTLLSSSSQQRYSRGITCYSVLLE